MKYPFEATQDVSANCHRDSGERQLDWLFCNPQDTEARGGSQHSKQISSSETGHWRSPDEMSKGFNVNRWKYVNRITAHNQSVSTCGDRAISCGHADHYLTAVWYSEGNPRELHVGWLQRAGKQRRNKKKGSVGGSFSSTSPLNINSARFLQTCRCLWVFFPSRTRKVMLSKKSV